MLLIKSAIFIQIIMLVSSKRDLAKGIVRRDSSVYGTGNSGSYSERKYTSSAVTNQNYVRKSISEQKCEEYAKSVKETIYIEGSSKQEETINHCAWTGKTLIIGGTPADARVYTHMALIGYVNKGVTDWQCGGSLISERFVLSAAHCSEVTIRHKTFQAEWVRLGELDIESESDDAAPINIKIVNRFVHPSYNKAQFYNDIALFQLASDVKFNKYIRPICLQNSFNINIKKFRPEITGWGATKLPYNNKGNKGSAILQKLKVNLTQPDDCIRSYKKFERNPSPIPQGINSSTMICAGDGEVKDACIGDSGGPLQIKLEYPECMFSQIGVISFGYKCAKGHPAVYTRVSYFVPWIESIVWPQ